MLQFTNRSRSATQKGIAESIYGGSSGGYIRPLKSWVFCRGLLKMGQEQLLVAVCQNPPQKVRTFSSDCAFLPLKVSKS